LYAFDVDAEKAGEGGGVVGGAGAEIVEDGPVTGTIGGASGGKFVDDGANPGVGVGGEDAGASFGETVRSARRGPWRVAEDGVERGGDPAKKSVAGTIPGTGAFVDRNGCPMKGYRDRPMGEERWTPKANQRVDEIS